VVSRTRYAYEPAHEPLRKPLPPTEFLAIAPGEQRREQPGRTMH
jgi:hypothetical protein